MVQNPKTLSMTQNRQHHTKGPRGMSPEWCSPAFPKTAIHHLGMTTAEHAESRSIRHVSGNVLDRCPSHGDDRKESRSYFPQPTPPGCHTSMRIGGHVPLVPPDTSTLWITAHRPCDHVPVVPPCGSLHTTLWITAHHPCVHARPQMFAGKSLTVIGHAGSLLPRMPARCGAHAKRWLEGHGAKVQRMSRHRRS